MVDYLLDTNIFSYICSAWGATSDEALYEVTIAKAAWLESAEQSHVHLVTLIKAEDNGEYSLRD
ncbi:MULTISPECIES: hypothetical protein [Nostocales]|uniref:PIN domain-containing protein n=3 Tax=Nostocales TaxID=1161 RepID=A0A8S9T279_9CYAN|nr:hypothetical protein [Tolypothrix bouteillei]KAF3885563.1 hypothetical protein DA73_0400008895 [Tolypothrix bouteillei VB521301]